MEPNTAPTARCAMALPVPMAKPCTTVPIRPLAICSMSRRREGGKEKWEECQGEKQREVGVSEGCGEWVEHRGKGNGWRGVGREESWDERPPREGKEHAHCCWEPPRQRGGRSGPQGHWREPLHGQVGLHGLRNGHCYYYENLSEAYLKS
jgi:hypothetical protein